MPYKPQSGPGAVTFHHNVYPSVNAKFLTDLLRKIRNCAAYNRKLPL